MQTDFNWSAPWAEQTYKPAAPLGGPSGPCDAFTADDVGGLFASEPLLFSDMTSTGWDGGHPGGSTTDILGMDEPTSLSTLPALGHMQLLGSAPDPPSLAVQGPVALGFPVDGTAFMPPAAPDAISGPNPAGSGGSGHATEEGFDVEAPLGPTPFPLAAAVDPGDPATDSEEVGNQAVGFGSAGGHPSPGSTSRSPQQLERSGGSGSSSPSEAALQRPTSGQVLVRSKRPALAMQATHRRPMQRRRTVPRKGGSGAGSSDEEAGEHLSFGGHSQASRLGEGPARASSRLQARSHLPQQGRFLDADFVTYDDGDADLEGEEPPSPSQRVQRTSVVRGRRGGGAAGGSGRKPAPSRAGKRTVPLAAQRIRATSARHESKGRPSFAEIVDSGFMRPGPHRFAVGNVEVAAAVEEDGAITYEGDRYRAISKFALVVLRERNPTRQSCDGWKEVAWNGEKLDALRMRVQQHARQQARQRTQ